MSTNKQKLELTWIGKDKRPRLEPRIFLEDKSLSYQAEPENLATEALFAGDDSQPKPLHDNLLIHGDNLLALKGLESDFSNMVDFVYIDPPFNTGGAFEHYDDGVEHSLWLSLMKQRLEVIKQLMKGSASIVVNLDDSEMAYCKVIMDEVFGRSNYITTIVVEAATSSSFKTSNVGPVDVAQYLLFYAKDKKLLKFNTQRKVRKEVDLQHFSRFIVNPDDDCKNWKFQSINDFVLRDLGYTEGSIQLRWNKIKKDMGDVAVSLVNQKANDFALDNAYRVFETKTLQKPSPYLRGMIERSREVDFPVHVPRDNYDDLYLLKGRQIYFLKNSVGVVDGEKGTVMPLTTIWNDIPTNNLQREGGVSFPSGKKPELLIRRLINMATDKGDLVLDSFAGSGTTAAVAHKLNRRWITIELGDQAFTHVQPRLKRVVSGEDQDGVSKAVNWQGGGGFRYLKLAPSLLKKDSWGNWIINKEYNPEMLAEAMCKHMGFTYAPSPTQYWNHGYSTESDYIYVTTGSLAYEQLKRLSEDVGTERTLLVCCKAFMTEGAEFPNLTLVKIPRAILNKCEWDQDDYSFTLNVLPDEPAAEAEMADEEE